MNTQNENTEGCPCENFSTNLYTSLHMLTKHSVRGRNVNWLHSGGSLTARASSSSYARQSASLASDRSMSLLVNHNGIKTRHISVSLLPQFLQHYILTRSEHKMKHSNHTTASPKQPPVQRPPSQPPPQPPTSPHHPPHHPCPRYCPQPQPPPSPASASPHTRSHPPQA